MRQAAQATGMDVTIAAAAAFNSKAIQDCDCRSKRRQNGRRAKLPKNIRTIGTVSSLMYTRFVKKL
jgi:hypothetical protein